MLKSQTWDIYNRLMKLCKSYSKNLRHLCNANNGNSFRGLKLITMKKQAGASLLFLFMVISTGIDCTTGFSVFSIRDV